MKLPALASLIPGANVLGWVWPCVTAASLAFAGVQMMKTADARADQAELTAKVEAERSDAWKRFVENARVVADATQRAAAAETDARAARDGALQMQAAVIRQLEGKYGKSAVDDLTGDYLDGLRRAQRPAARRR